MYIDDDLYEEDICYECEAYGDDYYEGEDGELICACDTCPFAPINREGDLDDI